MKICTGPGLFLKMYSIVNATEQKNSLLSLMFERPRTISPNL